RGVLGNVWPTYKGQPGHLRPGQPLANFFRETAVGALLELDAVAGLVRSLVGPDPLYDHHYFHVTKPGSPSQPLHYDAMIDFRLDFDVQVFVFFQDTPREMGGTLIVPGSHLRPAPALTRLHNVVGQLPIVCRAGTVLACHQGMWHCAQPNRSDRDRYMFKLRLNPTLCQTRLWDAWISPSPRSSTMCGPSCRPGTDGRVTSCGTSTFAGSCCGGCSRATTRSTQNHGC